MRPIRMVAAAHEAWIDRIFEQAKATALDAMKRRKFQQVCLTLEIRGGDPHEATMPDGEKLRPTRP